jgi:hypothetical protein
MSWRYPDAASLEKATYDTYTISDYLIGMVITRGGSLVFNTFQAFRREGPSTRMIFLLYPTCEAEGRRKRVFQLVACECSGLGDESPVLM